MHSVKNKMLTKNYEISMVNTIVQRGRSKSDSCQENINMVRVSVAEETKLSISGRSHIVFINYIMRYEQDKPQLTLKILNI